MSVAARVSAERAEDGSVGYAVRGDSKVTKRTKLLFATTGVALRRLGPGGDGLESLTHIIVDEVRRQVNFLHDNRTLPVGTRAQRRRRLLTSRAEGPRQTE